MTILKWLLFGGGVYFLAISVAHMLRYKVPLLFVYYDLPSYAYQDRIISFLSFGWSAFLFAAAGDPLKNRAAVKAIIVASLTGVLGLNVINSSTDFNTLAPNIDPSVFGREVLGLSIYVIALILLYFLAVKEKTDD